MSAAGIFVHYFCLLPHFRKTPTHSETFCPHTDNVLQNQSFLKIQFETCILGDFFRMWCSLARYFSASFWMLVWILMISEATSKLCRRVLALLWGLENRNIDDEINICKACCKTFPEQTRRPFWFNLPGLFDEMMLSRTLELISDSGFPVADVNRNHI